MKTQKHAFILLLSLLGLLAGCVAVDGTPLAELNMPAAAPAPAEAVNTVEIPLLPMSTGAPLNATAVFDLVSPSVAYVETESGSGSGVLIEGGYVVSNGHVVWPYNAVRVVFPDGTEFEDAEVVGWDLVADLALIKLPDTSQLDAQPLAFVDGSALTKGSDVYLLGYPGEVESFPQPAIIQGILARIRTWNATGMEAFQVDADVAGGQSGGVMVTERGEVIGITTYRFTNASYGLVPSAAFAVPRLNALANETGAGFSNRRPLGLSVSPEHTGQLEDETERDTYILEADAGEEVEITVEGVGHPRFYLVPLAYGWNYITSEEEDETVQSATFDVEKDDGPYVLVVTQQSTYRNDYTLTSSHPLARYDDPDDNRTLVIDEIMAGLLDMSEDSDSYTIELKEGDKIAVEVDSLADSPWISLRYETPTTLDVYRAYDGGESNVFGENARIVFEAPEDDTYTFVVTSGASDSASGYFLMASWADEDEELTEASESNEFVLSAYGRLKVYESEKYDFAINYPGGWRESYECPEGATACFEGGEVGLFIAEEDTDLFPASLGVVDQEAYANLIEELMLTNVPGANLLERSPITTPQGLVGTKLVLSAQAGLVKLVRYIYVNDDLIAFNASYFALAAIFDEAEDLFDGSFKSFRVWDEDNLETDPVYHLDEGLRLAGEKEYAAALDALTQAIELEPVLVEAYSLRGSIHVNLGDYELAIADIEQAIELDPDEISYRAQLAMIYWAQGDIDKALEVSDEVIELAPEKPGYYNNRALMRASAGDYEGGLEDMAQIVEIEEDDDLAPHYLDSRAFIYLKMEDYEAAKTDYDAALAKDFKSPYVLFGAGVAYARLGMMDEAMSMLEYGMELYEETTDEQDIPSPQMADLLEMISEYIDID